MVSEEIGVGRQGRLEEDVYKVGPLNASKIHWAGLPKIVRTVTSIEPFDNHGRDIIEITNKAEAAYIDSGLAKYQFPTFFHRELSEARNELNEIFAQQDRLLEERKQDVPEDLRERRMHEQETRSMERNIDHFRRVHVKGGIYPNKGQTPLDNREVNGVLMGQYEEGGRTIEVYSTGGYAITAKHFCPHTYRIFEFDSNGEILDGREIPPDPKGILKSVRGLLWLGTLSLSEVATGLAHWPMKKVLEGKVLRKAQENWARLRE